MTNHMFAHSSHSKGKCGPLQTPVSCSPPDSNPDKGAEYIFTCEIGNPLIRDAEVNFHFLLTAVSVDPSSEAVNIKMHVNR